MTRILRYKQYHDISCTYVFGYVATPPLPNLYLCLNEQQHQVKYLIDIIMSKITKSIACQNIAHVYAYKKIFSLFTF